MGEKCKPYYKNLNTIQSYSEQKYATVQWCEQNCMNDEWLRRQVEQLKYLTPPAVRKRFPIDESVDFSKSYGCTVTGTHKVGFDNSLTKEYIINFEETDDLKVDTNHTTAVSVNYTSTSTTDDGAVTSTGHRYQLPTTTETLEVQPEPPKTFGSINGDKGVNSAWYVAWDKSKKYYVRPDWLKNWRDSEIKSVCRGQTFKAEYTGTLQSVDLKMDWNGSKVSDCGSPLYVQIWKTYDRFLTVTGWDNTKKTIIYKYIKYTDAIAEDERYINKQRYKKVKKNKKKLNKYGQVVKDKKGNVVYVKDKKTKQIVQETAYVKDDNGDYVRKRKNTKWLGHNMKNPKWTGKDDTTHKKWLSDIYHPLAEAEYSKVGESFPNIYFDKPCQVKKGEYYAIVMFSPLSEWKHCPRIGGWGRNCKRDKIYPYGNAFMSVNNGRKWIRYGKNGADVDNKGNVLEYKKGRFTPQDFAFQCHVVPETDDPTTNTTFDSGEHILQFEPIYSNPITRLTVNPEQYGSEAGVSDLHIIYEVSTDGDVWSEINSNTRSISFEKDENNEYPTSVLLRAILWRGESTDGKQTPYIENLIVRLDTEPSKELYARTVAYAPRTNPMLGANVWGRIHAPFTTEPTVDCNVEIIKGNTVTEHYTIIEIGKVVETMEQLELDVTNIPIIQTTNSSSNNSDANSMASNEDSDNGAYLEVAQYLTNHTEVIDVLRKNKILVKPYEYENKLYLLSFAYSYNKDDLIITKSSTDEDSSTSGSTDTIFNEVGYKVGGIPLSNDVAYPVGSVQIQPSTTTDGSSVASFSEKIDYTFDYEENMLIFKKTTIDDLVDGDLSITYNPIFLKRLTNVEVGKRIDEETGLPEEGIILDYFKETITITEENIETRRVKLRVQPTDPIREVKLYRYNEEDSETSIELYEGFDFDLDIDTNELVFEVSNMDGVSSVLGLNDTLTVVYTPWLEDDKLYLGYYATRGEINRQVSIENYYMEYKA